MNPSRVHYTCIHWCILFVVVPFPKFGSGLTWHPMESEDSERLSKRKYSDLFKEQKRWLDR